MPVDEINVLRMSIIYVVGVIERERERDELHPPVMRQSLSQSETFPPLSAEHSIVCSWKPL